MQNNIPTCFKKKNIALVYTVCTTYGYETWKLNIGAIQKLKVRKRNMVWQILNVSQNDRERGL